MSALVDDGELTVQLDGVIPQGWKKRFRRTLHSLETSEWDAIRVKRTTVTVARVRPGTEERLRFTLESAVEQANSQFPDADDAPPEPAEPDPDVEMTARFRGFAGHD